MTAELRRLLAEATPGPWTKVTFGNASTAKVAGWMAHSAYATAREAGVPMTDLTEIGSPRGTVVGYTGNGPHSSENGDLIVAAVNALPALLDRLDALEAVATIARRGVMHHAADRDAMREALTRLEATR